MPKVQTIQFEVDMTAGELPFRSYASTKPVNGSLYVILSKLNSDNDVIFHLYNLDTVTTGTVKVMEKTVSQSKYTNLVKAIETDLRKVDPTVEFVLQNSSGFAVSSEGTALSSDERVEALVGAMKSMQIPPDKAAEIFQHLSVSEKTEVIAKLGLSSNDPEEKKLAESVSKLMQLASSLTGMKPEELLQEFEKETGKTHPGNRISKYL